MWILGIWVIGHMAKWWVKTKLCSKLPSHLAENCHVTLRKIAMWQKNTIFFTLTKRHGTKTNLQFQEIAMFFANTMAKVCTKKQWGTCAEQLVLVRLIATKNQLSLIADYKSIRSINGQLVSEKYVASNSIRGYCIKMHHVGHREKARCETFIALSSFSVCHVAKEEEKFGMLMAKNTY